MSTCAYSRSCHAPVRWALMTLLLALVAACGRQPDPSSAFAPAATDAPAEAQASVQPYPAQGQAYPVPTWTSRPAYPLEGQTSETQGQSNGLPGTPGIPPIDYAAKVLGVVIDGNGVVLYVEPQSGAAQAGIQAGDQIIAINGVDFGKDREGAKSQLISTRPEDAVKLKIRKSQGDEAEVDVTRLYQGEGSSPNAPTPTPVLPPNDYF